MKTKFIVVDDDPVSNKICNYTIRKVLPDADVFCFEHPADGLGFISSAYADTQKQSQTILFLDINMPEINGWEFLKEFAQMQEHVHKQFTIYIVSTSIDLTDHEKAAAHPFVTDYLEKPINKEMLIRLINN